MIPTIYIFLLLAAALLAIIFIVSILSKIKRFETLPEQGGAREGSIYAEIDKLPRKNCAAERVYCFEDLDCLNNCRSGERNVCRNGICLNRTVITTAPHHDCEAKAGKFALFTGNPALGTYEWICESIDPGVAVPNETNRMCRNGVIDIDYFRGFPAPSDCFCPADSAVLIGGTSSVRRLVQCDGRYADLLRLVLPPISLIE